MRLLGVLDLPGVLPRCWVDILLAIELSCLIARGVDRRLRQRGRVGTHIGNVAVLVEPLGNAHGPLGAEPQLAASLLLQGRRHERRVGTAGVGLLLHRRDGQRSTLQTGGQGVGCRLIEHQYLGGLADHAQGVEITPGRDAHTVDGNQAGIEPRRGGGRVGNAGIEFGQDVPVRGTAEGHPLPLALHNDPRRNRLHPTGRQPGGNFFPQHRADLVAVQPVEDAPGLLGVDQVDVEVTGVLGGRPNRRLGDLVEHHPAHRDRGFQCFQQMPGDSLALAVAVGGQI